jgi:hypothetical protein
MPQTGLKLTSRALILAKVEATEGTDSIDTGGTPGASYTAAALVNAVLVSALTVTPQAEEIDRNIVLSTLSPQGHVVGNRWCEIAFTTELRGRSTAVFDNTSTNMLRQDPLMRACAFSPTYAANSSSVIYKPVSSNLQTCTIYANLDGMLHRIRGCRGNVNTIMESGQFGRQEWTFTGVYDAVATANSGGFVEVTMPTPGFLDQSLFPLPVLKYGSATTVVLHGSASTSLTLQSVTVNMNNQVTYRPDMQQTTGVIGSILGSRNPQGTCNPEMIARTASSPTDWWLRWQNGTTGALTVVIGDQTTQPGQVITVNVPKAKFRLPSYGDRNGVLTMELPFSCVAATDAGDDEVVFTYS